MRCLKIEVKISSIHHIHIHLFPFSLTWRLSTNVRDAESVLMDALMMFKLRLRTRKIWWPHIDYITIYIREVLGHSGDFLKLWEIRYKELEKKKLPLLDVSICPAALPAKYSDVFSPPAYIHAPAYTNGKKLHSIDIPDIHADALTDEKTSDLKSQQDENQ